VVPSKWNGAENRLWKRRSAPARRSYGLLPAVITKKRRQDDRFIFRRYLHSKASKKVRGLPCHGWREGAFTFGVQRFRESTEHLRVCPKLKTLARCVVVRPDERSSSRRFNVARSVLRGNRRHMRPMATSIPPFCHRTRGSQKYVAMPSFRVR
jgi:hypothetical protein